MHRLQFIFLLAFFPFCIHAQNQNLLQTITVPVDHKNPTQGITTVSYELGAAFSKNKPTVFIIADAQQFYVRKGAVAGLQASLFDSTFNVVGIIGRNNNEDLKKLVTANGNTDWIKAHTIFSWEQYINDINEVRKKLMGSNGHINLYGQSGGGYLIHQFLSVYGQFVDKAFTAAAVNYHLDAQAGINHDKFWEEVIKDDPQFAAQFKKLSAQSSTSREMIAMLFQRQNFFVKPDSLAFERKKLLDILLANDTAMIRQYRDKYQITAIQNFYASADGIPIKVRLFEFVLPLLKTFRLKKDTLQPDMENLYFSSRPLIEAYNSHKIQPRTMPFTVQRKLDTKVFILAGRWDHTADYRSQTALAGIYRNRLLFMADDNHTFAALKKEGQYKELILLFFKSISLGLLDMIVKKEYEKYLWKE